MRRNGPRVLVSSIILNRSRGKLSSGPLPEIAALLTTASSLAGLVEGPADRLRRR